MADKPADVKLSEKVGKGEAIVGSAAEYAAYVNFGTKNTSSQPFLSTAGNIVAQSLVKKVTAAQQIAMHNSISKSFNKQIKDGVEIIKYGKPSAAADFGNEAAIKEAAIDVTSRAKALTPVDQGYLRNSIMWRTEKDDGGFNK